MSIGLAGCQNDRKSAARRFPIDVVANGLDLTVFRPMPKPLARAALGLPGECKILMFGADSLPDPRKGVHLLQAALDLLQSVCTMM